MPNPLVTLRRQQQWQNRHQNVSLTVDRYCEVWNLWDDGTAPTRRVWEAGLAGLVEVVKSAEKLGKRVRAVGGAWSLSQAAVSQDFMVNTRPLNYVELGVREASVDPAFTGDRGRLVFAQCGVSVLELNQYLEARGFSLPTSGASNGQTIAGAVSTGTHGSANQIGSMQDFILGVHLVGEGGKHYWIERLSLPVVSAAFCQALGAELRRDDALFWAVIVGFGSFGLIHAVMFEAEPIFLLESHVQRFDYATIKASLATLDVSALNLRGGTGLPFHYEVTVNPYRTSPGQRGAYARYMWKRPFAALPAGNAEPGFTIGDDAMNFFADVSDVVLSAIPSLVDFALSDQLKERTAQRGTHAGTFGNTNVRGTIMSTEIGVALGDADNAVDAVIAVAGRFPFAGAPAMRFVKGSQATLAFTHFSPITCTIEIPAAGSSRTLEAMEMVWDELDARGIPFTLHWGQILRTSPERVEAAYGARWEAWRAARRAFLSPLGRRTFANGMLVSLGLAD
jgi:FAD/FMN-containing dehydrogenase